MNQYSLTHEDEINKARFGARGRGFYESYFLRGNHPTRPLAFWLRYTSFCPDRDPGKCEGELWAILFDRENARHVALKSEVPWAECKFDLGRFDVRIGSSTLGPGEAAGGIRKGDDNISWALRFRHSEAPLFLMPEQSYKKSFPTAKVLTPAPMASFEGIINVNGKRIDVDGWRGSQNHNWGPRHTDRYAWAQVAGFDAHPESFLETATGWQKIGPLWSPALTFLVLRHRGREYALKSLRQALNARARLKYFDWNFSTATKDFEIEAKISAKQRDFVGLAYRNPPGGKKHCLNSKIAACKIIVKDRITGDWETLETRNRAAFEILTDDNKHGVPIAA